MQFHQLKPQTKFRKGQRVGRGGKRGKTSGRGTKGQRSRAGAKIRPAIRDVLKKLPKKRGYRFRSFRVQNAVVSLARLEKHFPASAIIDPAALLKAGFIAKIKGRMPAVKILGSAPIKKKFLFRGLTSSRSARQAIEASGGTIR